MNDLLRDAAFRAGVWQVLEQRAKELKDAAKRDLADTLEAGDSVAGKWEGRTIAKATMTRGREKIVVTDERALLEWVKENCPTEIVEAVNPAFLKTFGVVDGQVHWQGHPVDFMKVEQGDPYISVRRDPEAAFVVAQLLSSGRLSLDGVREPVTSLEGVLDAVEAMPDRGAL